MLTVEIPGVGTLRLDHLVLDLNGTLLSRGTLIDGVAERLDRLAHNLEVRLATADTFGGASKIAAALNAELTVVVDGEEKAALVRRLGVDTTVAIGNGRNDVAMLHAVRLAIAVVGPEGAAREALATADIVCPSINDALDLLLDPRTLVATLRA